MKESEQGKNRPDQKSGPDQTRRAFVKTVAYVAPTILTLSATPALATYGSGGHKKDKDKDWDRDWDWDFFKRWKRWH